ncbi:MAG: hypothetical protein ACYTEL_05830 [Planctomycetota bacterium]|jgi:Rod binding domain-containing protein
MDNSKLILTEAVAAPLPLEQFSGALHSNQAAQLQARATDELGEEQKKQIAKDFESLLLSRLLDEMKNTIGDWGFEKDGASKQVQGIFWMYLARDIANSGGLGLWKDIYKFMASSDKSSSTVESLDKSV